MIEDVQIRMAREDIERSGEIIGNFETLDREKFPFIDNMISFHRLRIANCHKAIRKFEKK